MKSKVMLLIIAAATAAACGIAGAQDMGSLTGLAGGLDLAHYRERGLAVRAHKHDLVHILVVPDLNVQDVFRPDDVVLVLGALGMPWRRKEGA